MEDEPANTTAFIRWVTGTCESSDLDAVFRPYLIGAADLCIHRHEQNETIAFIDLGSIESVARAVSDSRSPGLFVHGNRLIVKPSKTPMRSSRVRPSTRHPQGAEEIAEQWASWLLEYIEQSGGQIHSGGLGYFYRQYSRWAPPPRPSLKEMLAKAPGLVIIKDGSNE